jgi:ribonuclease P protein component
MLPRAARLKHNRDFRHVYARKRSFSSPTLVLYIRPRSSSEDAGHCVSRFGFVVSKKTARRAHDRNRLKRRLREICRTNLLGRLRADAPVDALFVARASAVEADFARLAADVESLGRQAGLF